MSADAVPFSIDEIMQFWIDGEHSSFNIALVGSTPLERSWDAFSEAIRDALVTFGTDELVIADPVPMPTGPVAEMELETGEVLRDAVAFLSERPAVLGVNGYLKPVATEVSRLNDPIHPVPGIAVGLSIQGVYDPSVWNEFRSEAGARMSKRFD